MNDNVTFGGLAVVAVVLPAALGIGLGWPAWVSVALIVVLLAAVAVVRRSRARTEVTPPTWPSAPLPDQPPAVETAPVQAIIGSSVEGFAFQFSATVRWRLVRNQGRTSHADPSSLAKDAVLQRAAAIAGAFIPTDHVQAQHRVAAALGVEDRDERQLVLASAIDVNVTVPEEQSKAVGVMADQLRQARLDEARFVAERRIREYLHNEALQSTGSALVWWLSRHLESVEQAVGLIDTLRRLSVVAQDGEDPGRADERVFPIQDHLAATVGSLGSDGGSRHPEDDLVRLFDAMFPDGDPRRLRFAHELANLAADFHPATADRIRRLFGLHLVQSDEPEDDVPPPADPVP
jgi:hypothetical protein